MTTILIIYQAYAKICVMSFEFTPENFLTNTQETQHPQQDTLEHLLDVVGVMAGENHSGFKRSDLEYPTGSPFKATTLKSFEAGFHPNNQNLVAEIIKNESVGDIGSTLSTKYHIFQTPDGLEIKRYTEAIERTNELKLNPTPQDKLEFVTKALRDRKKTNQAVKAARSDEDHLGISFVSEQETKDLLSFVNQLVPRSH